MSSAMAQTDIYLMLDVKANPPYILTEGEEEPTRKSGASFAILAEVSKRLNVRFHFQRIPWMRGLKRLEVGESDGLFHASYRQERAQYSAYPMREGNVDRSRRLMTQTYFLYTHKDSRIDWDGTYLRNVNSPIGATIGYSIVGDLIKLGAQVEEAHSHDVNFVKVIKGRSAGYAQLEQIADNYLSQYPDKYRHIVKHPIPLKRKDYFLIFSNKFMKHHARLADKIWDEFAQMRQNGEFSKIILSYSN